MSRGIKEYTSNYWLEYRRELTDGIRLVTAVVTIAVLTLAIPHNRSLNGLGIVSGTVILVHGVLCLLWAKRNTDRARHGR